MNGKWYHLQLQSYSVCLLLRPIILFLIVHRFIHPVFSAMNPHKFLERVLFVELLLSSHLNSGIQHLDSSSLGVRSVLVFSALRLCLCEKWAQSVCEFRTCGCRNMANSPIIVQMSIVGATQRKHTQSGFMCSPRQRSVNIQQRHRRPRERSIHLESSTRYIQIILYYISFNYCGKKF